MQVSVHMDFEALFVDGISANGPGIIAKPYLNPNRRFMLSALPADYVFFSW